MKKDNSYLFEKMPVSKAIISLAIPAIISQIITVIYNMADTFFIGQIGDPNQVAAVTLAMPAFVMLTGIASLLGLGGSTVISRFLGAGERENAKRCAAFCIWTAGVVAAVYGILLFAFRSYVLPVLGTDEFTYDFCKDYIFWTITIGAAPTVLNTALGNLLLSEGYSKESSIGIALGGVMNIILDPIFIFALDLGVSGAAIATMLSNLIATVFFIVFILYKKDRTALTISPRYYTLKHKIPSLVLTTGFPGFIIVVMSIISSWSANLLVGNASNQAVAGMGIAKKIDSLMFALTRGMTHGVLPLISYNYASKNKKRLLEIMKKFVIYGIVMAAACTLILFVFAVPLSAFFIDDADTVSYAQHYLRIISLSCIPMLVANMLMTIFLATKQKAKAMIVSLTKRGLVDAGCMLVMHMLMQEIGIPWGTFIADTFNALFALAIFVPYFKKFKAEMQAMPSVNAQSESALAPSHTEVYPIITIGRSYGSGGRTIGKLVAERMGIHYYDSEILQEVAEKTGLSQKFLEGVDEKKINLSMLYGYKGIGIVEYSNIALMADTAQREVVEAVAEKGSCVIIGRRADQILQDHPKLFRVFITASIDHRAERIMQREGLSKEESIHKIHLVDEERSQYYGETGNNRWGVSDNYDLCLNTDAIRIEEAVNTIVQLVNSKNS